MTADELKERTMQFALRSARLVESLPRTRIGRLVEDQLGRSATGVGANYRASCKARSRAEFVAKIGVAEEEADESAYWLEFITRFGLMKQELVQSLWTESMELSKILGKSRITASRNGRKGT